MCALTANGQIATMTKTAINTQIKQTLDIHGNFTP
jgi:hypothetical protein